MQWEAIRILAGSLPSARTRCIQLKTKDRKEFCGCLRKSFQGRVVKKFDSATSRAEESGGFWFGALF